MSEKSTDLGKLEAVSAGNADPILHNLGACLRALLERPEENNSLLVDQIALAFQNHLYQTCSAIPAWSPKARGGLAPWQESRAKEAMEAGRSRRLRQTRKLESASDAIDDGNSWGVAGDRLLRFGSHSLLRRFALPMKDRTT